jgi:2,3-dihydroxybenzoate decarboxylase
VETGTHVLRMIAGGVFDRFPKLRMVIGHMGEALPFQMQRIDNRYLNSVRVRNAGKLKRLPSEYLLDHFHITTSGMNYQQQLMMTIQLFGVDRIMFAADYPFEEHKENGTELFDAMPLCEDDKKKLYQTNAERVFNLA